MHFLNEKKATPELGEVQRVLTAEQWQRVPRTLVGRSSFAEHTVWQDATRQHHRIDVFMLGPVIDALMCGIEPEIPTTG